jgi:hypothetical protein
MRPRRLILFVAVVIASATAAVEAAREAPAPTAATPPAIKSETLQEVTVTAKHATLAPRVRKFVNQIAALEFDDGLARWHVPVCPLVSGLPPQGGEWILRRVSEIARIARVPLARDRCLQKNLFIFVTADPRGLLQLWDDRTSSRVGVFNGATWVVDPGWQFGAPQHVIEAFIRSPRAVRVWYYTHCSRGDGCTPGRGLSSIILYDFFRVFVIVDQTRLSGVTIGQLADYVSMVSLAQIKAGAQLGDAPTILKLFEVAPQAAPAGMTDWDGAFLKSLYDTEPRPRAQRRLIARAMVRAVTH